MSVINHHFDLSGLPCEHEHHWRSHPYRLVIFAGIKNCVPAYWLAGHDKVDPNAENTLREAMRVFKCICFYCKKAQATTIDHVLPKSKGSTEALANLVVACTQCNKRKADQTLQQYDQQTYIKWQKLRQDALEAAIRAASAQ